VPLGLGVGVGVGVGLADGLDVGLTDCDARVLGLVLALVLAPGEELIFRDDPADGLPADGECPADAGDPPALPAAGVVPCLPPGLAEPPAADLAGVDPTAPVAPGCEEFSACVVCVWE
jgi:hypothetical protein